MGCGGLTTCVCIHVWTVAGGQVSAMKGGLELEAAGDDSVGRVYDQDNRVTECDVIE